MAFTVDDMHELTNFLILHPEWRAEVRRLVLTDELLALPQTVQALVVAQQRTEQRVGELVVAQQHTEERLNQLAERTEARLQRLEASVAELVAAQQQTETRLQRLETAVTELVAAQQQTETRLQRLETAVTELVAAQQQTEARLQRLEAAVAELTRVVTVLSKTEERMQTRLSKVDGWQLERSYVDRAAGYFGNWLRRVRVVWPGELDEVLEDRLETILTIEERNEVLRLDAIVRGKVRQLPDQPEVYLAVEASLTIERNDVARALRRAALLQRLGVRTIPVVAGETIEAAAEEDAAQNGVAVLQNGYSQGWERALSAT